ncbi:hypothetical protein K2X89_02315, partial [Myxococcota bacterium]|nr:hypothetical protein [Myxococcota bacterium]
EPAAGDSAEADIAAEEAAAAALVAVAADTTAVVTAAAITEPGPSRRATKPRGTGSGTTARTHTTSPMTPA